MGAIRARYRQRIYASAAVTPEGAIRYLAATAGHGSSCWLVNLDTRRYPAVFEFRPGCGGAAV